MAILSDAVEYISVHCTGAENENSIEFCLDVQITKLLGADGLIT